ncbi:MAG: methyltransferase MtaB domain-containing protein, partial [Armatimonadota bacterium]
MPKFRTMAYKSPEDMVFGRALRSVSCGFDLTIGAGWVIPELKYAPRPGSESSLDSMLDEYRRITQDALSRAVAIGLPSIVLELE